MLTIIAIILLYLAIKKFGERIKKFVVNILGFEHIMDEFEKEIDTTYCPDKLMKLYGELQTLHNDYTEFDYQKQRVKEKMLYLNIKIKEFSM